MRLTERIAIFVWKIRHHDQIIQGLEADLEAAEDEIDRMKNELKRLKGVHHEETVLPAPDHNDARLDRVRDRHRNGGRGV